MSESLSWSRLSEGRRRFREAHPAGFWALPLVRKSEDLVCEAVTAHGCSLLDVGAGDRFLKDYAERSGVYTDYRSVDPDGGREHDYRSLDEVEGTFDVIACLEVIEHIDPVAAVALLVGMRERLAPGGVLVLSTPNVMNPTAFLTTVDHRTPWAWEEMGGVLDATGFRVQRMVRVKNDPWLRRMGRKVMLPLHRALGIDFAVSIAAVAACAETDAEEE